MSARSIVVVIAAVVGIGLGLAWIDSAHRAGVAGAARIDDKLAELEFAYQSSANRVALEAQLGELQVMLDSMQLRLPPRLDAVALERELREQAVESGVEVSLVDAGEEQAREFYAKLPLELRLHGPNENVYALLAEIARGAPLRHMAALEVAPRGIARDVLDARVVLEVFRYRDEDELE